LYLESHSHAFQWKQLEAVFASKRWIEMIESNRRLSDQSEVVLRQPLTFWYFPPRMYVIG